MQLSLHNGSASGVTVVSNVFLDYYMPRANGEFVKIYLYLLRLLGAGQGELTLAEVADVFSCTETTFSERFATGRRNGFWYCREMPPRRLRWIFWNPWCLPKNAVSVAERQILPPQAVRPVLPGGLPGSRLLFLRVRNRQPRPGRISQTIPQRLLFRTRRPGPERLRGRKRTRRPAASALTGSVS